MEFASQKDFLNFAHEQYQQASTDILFRPNSFLCAKIEWLYKLGRDYQVLNIDFYQFKSLLVNSNNHRWWYKRNKQYYGTHSHYCSVESFRTLRSFTQHGLSKKNNPSYNEWRIKKGFKRDKTKRRSDPAKANVKYFSARKHRVFERLTLANGNYDAFHSKTYKRAEDIWSWD